MIHLELALDFQPQLVAMPWEPDENRAGRIPDRVCFYLCSFFKFVRGIWWLSSQVEGTPWFPTQWKASIMSLRDLSRFFRVANWCFDLLGSFSCGQFWNATAHRSCPGCTIPYLTLPCNTFYYITYHARSVSKKSQKLCQDRYIQMSEDMSEDMSGYMSKNMSEFSSEYTSKISKNHQHIFRCHRVAGNHSVQRLRRAAWPALIPHGLRCGYLNRLRNIFFNRRKNAVCTIYIWYHLVSSISTWSDALKMFLSEDLLLASLSHVQRDELAAIWSAWSRNNWSDNNVVQEAGGSTYSATSACGQLHQSYQAETGEPVDGDHT